MRRGLAALILGLSLVVASVAWSGYVLTHTVLDPNRSERLADQVLDNPVLRAALIDRLATSMEAAVPGDTPIPRQLLETAAATALDNPEVENLVRNGIVGVHRSALEGNAQPVTVDAAALGSASRAALVNVQPELDAVLPAAPALEVELPVGGLSVLGRIRSFVEQATTILAFIAIIGATTAFAIAKNRPAVLRRVAFWAFGTAMFWIIVGFGIPFLAERIAPSSTAIISAFIDVFFGAMIRPGIFMAAFGGACLAASFFWAAGSATAGARLLQPGGDAPLDRQPNRGSGRGGVGSTASNIRRPSPNDIAAAQRAEQQRQAYEAQQRASHELALRHQAAQQAAGAQRPPTYTQPPASTPRPVDPTTAIPQPSAGTRPSTGPQPSATPPETSEASPFGRAPRWEPGVGYLDDDTR
ncbi:MAG: hypothetical protein R2733_14010 [Acidimicrobiales bacterium]